MDDAARNVPVSLLEDVVKSAKGFPDPRGSRGLMHYSTLWKSGKNYNLEVLYDKQTSTVWHFSYYK